MVFFSGLVFILGLIVGSFASVFTYRFPKGKNYINGRSVCDHCGKKLYWFDNLPLISFLFLKGKCRFCSKRISGRYPAIELATGFLGVLLYVVFLNCRLLINPVCVWRAGLGVFSFPLLAAIFLLTIFIYVIDLEKRIIPDGLIFISWLLVGLALVLGDFPFFYRHFLAGFLAAAVLLSIHLATKGKGMGLGDVKYALVPATFLGLSLSLVWLFLSFLTGAVVAIILILVKRARGKDKIAFGPFLAFSFVIVALFGNTILKCLFP